MPRSDSLPSGLPWPKKHVIMIIGQTSFRLEPPYFMIYLSWLLASPWLVSWTSDLQWRILQETIIFRVAEAMCLISATCFSQDQSIDQLPRSGWTDNFIQFPYRHPFQLWLAQYVAEWLRQQHASSTTLCLKERFPQATPKELSWCSARQWSQWCSLQF